MSLFIVKEIIVLKLCFKFLTFEIGTQQDCLLTRGEASSDFSMSDVPMV